jgi:hypothetical protein
MGKKKCHYAQGSTKHRTCGYTVLVIGGSFIAYIKVPAFINTNLSNTCKTNTATIHIPVLRSFILDYLQYNNLFTGYGKGGGKMEKV